MALIETNDGLWFQEDIYPEIACGFKVSAVLHHERSAFQDILILDTPALGKVLALDGIVQCAQKDEAIYHEMLAHSGVLLRLALAPPEAGLDVLVVGGSDGGIARECLKHRRATMSRRYSARSASAPACLAALLAVCPHGFGAELDQAFRG